MSVQDTIRYETCNTFRERYSTIRSVAILAQKDGLCLTTIIIIELFVGMSTPGQEELASMSPRSAHDEGGFNFDLDLAIL